MHHIFVVASLPLSLVAAPVAAESAAPVDPAGCQERLLSVAVAAAEYQLILEGDELTGEFGELELKVQCSGDMLRLELVATGGELVTVSLDYVPQHAVLELEAWYPDVGWASRLVEAELSDPLKGRITFSAATKRETAAVDADLDGRVLATHGNPASVNADFANVLPRSATWAEAHRLAFALLNLEPASLAREVSELSLDAVVPNNRKGNKSIFAMGVACAKAMVGCGAAAVSGLPPAAVACYKDSVGCALSAACAWYSCID